MCNVTCVILSPSPYRFTACNIEKVVKGLVRGYNSCVEAKKQQSSPGIASSTTVVFIAGYIHMLAIGLDRGYP